MPFRNLPTDFAFLAVIALASPSPGTALAADTEAATSDLKLNCGPPAKPVLTANLVPGSYFSDPKLYDLTVFGTRGYELHVTTGKLEKKGNSYVVEGNLDSTSYTLTLNTTRIAAGVTSQNNKLVQTTYDGDFSNDYGHTSTSTFPCRITAAP